jgi:hypothetical protein
VSELFDRFCTLPFLKPVLTSVFQILQRSALYDLRLNKRGALVFDMAELAIKPIKRYDSFLCEVPFRTTGLPHNDVDHAVRGVAHRVKVAAQPYALVAPDGRQRFQHVPDLLRVLAIAGAKPLVDEDLGHAEARQPHGEQHAELLVSRRLVGRQKPAFLHDPVERPVWAPKEEGLPIVGVRGDRPDRSAIQRRRGRRVVARGPRVLVCPRADERPAVLRLLSMGSDGSTVGCGVQKRDHAEIRHGVRLTPLTTCVVHIESRHRDARRRLSRVSEESQNREGISMRRAVDD